ncbi:Obscurin, partial [Ophiophagus hannah]
MFYMILMSLRTIHTCCLLVLQSCVLPKPKIPFKTKLQDLEVREKDSVIFLCEVPRCDVETTWFKEETRLQQNDKYKIEEDGICRKLTIQNVTMDDDAVYICEMKEGSRTIAELSVQGAWQLTHIYDGCNVLGSRDPLLQPADQSVRKPDSLNDRATNLTIGRVSCWVASLQKHIGENAKRRKFWAICTVIGCCGCGGGVSLFSRLFSSVCPAIYLMMLLFA